MNDWGRESGRTARRGGAGGVLLFVFSLLFLAGGAALALGLVPLSQFGIGAEAGKDARIAQLERELDAALNERVSGGEGDESYAVVVEQRDRLAGELANLKAQVGRDQPSSDGDAAQLREELERSRQKVAELTTSLTLAEGVIEDLQARSETSSSDAVGQGNSDQIAELEAKLAQRDTILSQFDGEIERLTAASDALKDERDKLQQDYSQIQGELAKAQSRAEQLQQQIISLDAEEGNADAATDDNKDGAAARVSELEDELARREATLTQFNAEIERLSASAEALKQERDDLQGERSQLQGELAKAQARAEQLEQQVAALESELDEARQAVTGPLSTQPVEDSGEASVPSENKQPANAAGPRDPLQVASALASAKGLGNLNEAQRDAIATALIEGECVADTLAENLDRVPVLAMRDMIRLLEADC